MNPLRKTLSTCLLALAGWTVLTGSSTDVFHWDLPAWVPRPVVPADIPPLRRRCPQGLVGERGASSAAARDTAEQRLPSNRSVPGRESGDRRGRALPHDRHATLRPFRWSSVMQPFIAPSDGSRHLPSAKPEPIARCFCQSRQTLNTRLEASPSTSCFDWHRASCPSGRRGTDP